MRAGFQLFTQGMAEFLRDGTTPTEILEFEPGSVRLMSVKAISTVETLPVLTPAGSKAQPRHDSMLGGELAVLFM